MVAVLRTVEPVEVYEDDVTVGPVDQIASEADAREECQPALGDVETASGGERAQVLESRERGPAEALPPPGLP